MDGILIEQVSTFPQLYAKTDGRYKNNRMRENAWLTIAQIMDETPEACEHRWKLLRNKYTGLKRTMKNTPSGSGTSQITWPYFKMMGFLDKYLQTRKSYSNIGIQNKPEREEWNSMSQIVIEYDEQNIETATRSDIVWYEESSSTQNVTSKSVTPKRAITTKPILKRANENENIPRFTIPSKKPKTTEALTEEISGCFDTFNKVLEKNIIHQPPAPVISDDEYFVRSLAADISVFSKMDKIILKKTIYYIICTHHLETVESDNT